MPKLDYNVLKEIPDEFEKYSNMLPGFEKEGKFTTDQDTVVPGSFIPIDDNFPYIRKGFKWWIKSKFFNRVLNYYSKLINKNLTNLKVEGRENLAGVKAAIVTCNHISKVDSFAVREALKDNIMFVGAEHNNWKGLMGEIARNTGYIPLPKSFSLKLMRKFNEAIEYYLMKNKRILIYPEQAMWREFTRPRPLQNGAFHYAVINNVPVVPMFITIEQKPEPIDEKGRQNFGNYTIHILPPIYPKFDLPPKENENYMKLENFRLWKECYEKTYGKPLQYSTDKAVWDENFSEYNEILNPNSSKK